MYINQIIITFVVIVFLLVTKKISKREELKNISYENRNIYAGMNPHFNFIPIYKTPYKDHARVTTIKYPNPDINTKNGYEKFDNTYMNGLFPSKNRILKNDKTIKISLLLFTITIIYLIYNYYF